MIRSHVKRLSHYQKIVSVVSLQHLFQLVIKLSSFVSPICGSPHVPFYPFLCCRLSLSSWLVLTFFHSPIICTVTLHPLIPLVFPSTSILTPLVLTCIVIPSPQCHLNDFILPRLCLLLLMMCLLLSHFDVDYRRLLLFCVCVLQSAVESEWWWLWWAMN